LGLRDEWLRYHAYHERPVRMMMHDGRLVDGIVKGVADDGILFSWKRRSRFTTIFHLARLV
jgi:biotin-(acetyl-CoA carboxylase) ligase